MASRLTVCVRWDFEIHFSQRLDGQTSEEAEYLVQDSLVVPAARKMSTDRESSSDRQQSGVWSSNTLPKLGKGEGTDLLEIRGFFVCPNANGSVTDWERSETSGIDRNVPIFPAKNVPPLLSSVSLTNEHSLESSVPAVCHDDGKSSPIGFRLVAESCPADAIFGVTILSLGTISVQFACSNEPRKLSSA